jgi:hypothetical protein
LRRWASHLDSAGTNPCSTYLLSLDKDRVAADSGVAGVVDVSSVSLQPESATDTTANATKAPKEPVFLVVATTPPDRQNRRHSYPNPSQSKVHAAEFMRFPNGSDQIVIGRVRT